MFVSQHFAPRWNKEWIPLATQQLRLRNLIQILAFSIKNDCVKKETVGSKIRDSVESKYSVHESYYFTLHATTMSAPFYTSEKLKSDSPKWKEFEISAWEGNVSNSVDALVIRLWFNNPHESEDRVLAVWGVYLSGLLYLGPNLGSDIPLKPNSLIFLMPGGYFTDPKCIDSSATIRYTSVMVNNCDVRPSYSISSLTRLQALQQVIRKEVAEADMLKKKISMGDFFRSESRGRTTLRKLLSKHKPKTHHTDLMKIKENIEIAKYRVNLLKEEKTVLLQKLKGLNKQIQSLYEGNQLAESKIVENYHLLRQEVHNHRDWKRSYIDRREKYLHSKAMLNFRTKQLISELNLIYPILEVSPDKFTICGVHLPNSEDFTGRDELQISVALGFVTHVIQMISVFLQIPLRYPVIHFGSRSRIVDQITDKFPDSEREFCLFVKGKEKLQFHYAVFLLNKNIAQMRWLCGLPTSDLRNTLENLASLVKMKFGNSCLDQNSRSLSSSTVDVCSSTVSVSSPLSSVMSFQTKKHSRIHYLSESGMDVRSKSGNPFRHRVSKSIGSSKDLIPNAISLKKKNCTDEKGRLNSNLSFSLDKGLNEYEEISAGKQKDNGQFGSDPLLNASANLPKVFSSDAKDRFLQCWNVESQKVPFSDDDSEIHMVDCSYKKQNISHSSGGDYSREETKEFDITIDKGTVLMCDSTIANVLSTNVTNEPSKIQITEKSENANLEEEKIVNSVQTQTDNSSLKAPIGDIKKCDLQDNLVLADSLFENVTSRTEALATQITSFNRFRTRFKSTLESSN